MTTIDFVGIVYKVQTLAMDGGVRITIDLDDSHIPQMAMLAEARRQNMVLHFSVDAIEQTGTEVDGSSDRKRKRYPYS